MIDNKIESTSNGRHAEELSQSTAASNMIVITDTATAENTMSFNHDINSHKKARNPIVRHYSSMDLSTAAVISLATDIFESWDIEHHGYLQTSEITFKNIDQTFIEAILRVLAYHTNVIYKENVIECISVLQHGDLSSKVKLLVQFMDSDGNQSISFEELREYLKVSDDTMLEKLGLLKIKHRKNNSSSLSSDAATTTATAAPVSSTTETQNELRYEDILSLFEESDRGLEAINIFCQQILRIFTNSIQSRQQQQQQLSSNPYGSSFFLTRHRSFQNTVTNNKSHSSSNRIATILDDKEKKSVWTKSGICLTSSIAYLQKLSHIDKFKLWLIIFQIFLWLINFFHYKTNGFPLAFCFAKGFGLNLRILSILMYLTMARTTLGHLYAFRLLRWLIPLGENMMEIHSFLGFAMGLHMFGHTFGHIAYQTMYTQGFQHTFEQPSLLIGQKNTWRTHWRGDAITGFLLLFMILLMGGTACLRSISSTSYQIFGITHYLYLLYLPMIFLHVPNLWPYFFGIAVWMIFERGYDFVYQTIFTTLRQSRPCRNGITFISVPRYGTITYPGSYYRIKIPTLSMYEWHPFSLAGNISSHHLSFFIASSGDWTKGLYELVQDPNRRAQTLIQVQGPFLAPASQALIRKPGSRILCVASGIGITPFFSVMATKVSDEVHYENDRVLYENLFKENHQDPSHSNHYQTYRSHDDQRYYMKTRHQNSLFHALLETHQPASRNFRRQTSHPNHNTDATTAEGSNKQRPKVTMELIQEDEVLQDLESGIITKSNSRSKSGSHDSVDDDDDDDCVNDRESKCEGKPDFQDQDQNEDENDRNPSLLKVIWSIRDVKELLFYVDYVHHLVKSQDQLHHDKEDDTRNNKMKGKGQQTRNAHGRKHIVVEVEVYLTGLGNKQDPVYMLSQTLFLLSMANQSSSYMKIHFGRANLENIIRAFSPEEVYYCGGNQLKETLDDLCGERNIPFYPEAFDSGSGVAVHAYQSLSKCVFNWFHGESVNETPSENKVKGKHE